MKFCYKYKYEYIKNNKIYKHIASRIKNNKSHRKYKAKQIKDKVISEKEKQIDRNVSNKIF